MPWVMMMGPTGHRIFLNLDLCMAFAENPSGMAEAMSIGGVAVALGEKFDQVVADIVDEDEEESDPGAQGGQG